jgi:CRISPR-associated protein Cas6/Cse3/CasE subtype I-E
MTTQEYGGGRAVWYPIANGSIEYGLLLLCREEGWEGYDDRFTRDRVVKLLENWLRSYNLNRQQSSAYNHRTDIPALSQAKPVLEKGCPGKIAYLYLFRLDEGSSLTETDLVRGVRRLSGHGQVYQFRLVANTVVNRSAVAGQAGRSKRLPHVTALQRASWLVGSAAYEEVGREVPEYLVRQDESRAERSGFKVLPDEDSGMLKLVVSDLHEYDIRQRKKGNRIKLSTTRYDGVLEVTDAVKLKHALTHGIGHGKGFGCGLLTLALVR